MALALYAVTLGGVYIYDDVQIISNDPRVRDPHLWWQLWTRDYFNGGIDNLYRPLVSQTYGIQWWIDGGSPWMFHAFNVVLHAGVAALVAELARRLTNWRVGLIAGLLFAAHPVHSEAVAGIVGRAELMCACGMLGAMVIYLMRPMTGGRVIVIFALSVVAMLSKEQGLLMPLLLLTLEPVRRMKKPPGGPASGSERKSMHWLIILLTWSVSLLIVMREQVLKLRFEWDRSFLDYTINPLVRSHGIDRLLIPLMLLGRYFGIVVAPLHLSIDYGFAVLCSTVARGDLYLWLGVLLAIAWLVAAWICTARRRWVELFCLLGIAINYSMISNLFVIGTIFGERLIYLPSAFFLILLAIYLEKLPSPVWRIALGMLVALGCLRTFTYIRHWNNQDSFYVYSLENQPRSVRLHMLVAYRDYEEDRLNDARQVMADARALAPDYWQAWMYAGRVEEKAGNWQAAFEYLNRARRIQPSFALDNRTAHAAQMLDDQRKAATRKSSN